MLTENPKVFISHAWEDKNFVRRLEDKLRTTDSDIWVDHSDVRGGDRISKRVSDALEWCNTLLLVWSRTASESKWVELEWNAAVNLQKTVIPCLLDATKLPAILTGMAYIDFRNFDMGIEQLWHALSFPIADEVNKKQSKQKQQDKTTGIVKILFLAANPTNTKRLRVDAEMREIDETLRQTKYRDYFEVKSYGAVRFFDIQNYLLLHRPHVVHFSGHGSESGEILLEDDDGHSQRISASDMSKLFEVLKDNTRCVLLNACYLENQAQVIAKYVDCVIGMSKEISDLASRKFSVAFYNALGNGKDVKSAFDLGRANIGSENRDEQDIPKLLAINKNPKEIFLVQSEFIEADDKPGDNTKIFQTVTGNQNIFSGTGNVTITNQPKD